MTGNLEDVVSYINNNQRLNRPINAVIQTIAEIVNRIFKTIVIHKEDYMSKCNNYKDLLENSLNANKILQEENMKLKATIEELEKKIQSLLTQRKNDEDNISKLEDLKIQNEKLDKIIKELNNDYKIEKQKMDEYIAHQNVNKYFILQNKIKELEEERNKRPRNLVLSHVSKGKIKSFTRYDNKEKDNVNVTFIQIKEENQDSTKMPIPNINKYNKDIKYTLMKHRSSKEKIIKCSNVFRSIKRKTVNPSNRSLHESSLFPKNEL